MNNHHRKTRRSWKVVTWTKKIRALLFTRRRMMQRKGITSAIISAQLSNFICFKRNAFFLRLTVLVAWVVHDSHINWFVFKFSLQNCGIRHNNSIPPHFIVQQNKSNTFNLNNASKHTDFYEICLIYPIPKLRH